jgi:hypothetical protein
MKPLQTKHFKMTLTHLTKQEMLHWLDPHNISRIYEIIIAIECDLNLLWLVKRVNSANVLDEGLRIGGIRHRMNSKVMISRTRCVSRINVVINLAYFQSIPDRPLLAPIYRWPGLKEPVGSNTYYNVYIQHGLVL